MHQQSNKSNSFGQKQGDHEGQRQIYNMDWTNVCKEEAMHHPSTQPFYTSFHHFISNLPYVPQPYRYSSMFQSRIPLSRFPFFPMAYQYQVNLKNHSGDFQKIVANTQASQEDQNKRQTVQAKIQEQDYEENYLTVKQQFKNQPIQPIKNQTHIRQQPLYHIDVNPKGFGNSEASQSITRKDRVNRYKIKKEKRRYEKRIVYQCRKSVADHRQRFKGRFVKRIPNKDNIQKEVFLKKEESMSS